MSKQNKIVVAWPKATGTPLELPLTIMRPCDFSLLNAVQKLETQLGTIEAYNRLVKEATAIRARIDAKNIKPQNPLYAESIRGD